jgi:hypothetical protein
MGTSNFMIAVPLSDLKPLGPDRPLAVQALQIGGTALQQPRQMLFIFELTATSSSPAEPA